MSGRSMAHPHASGHLPRRQSCDAEWLYLPQRLGHEVTAKLFAPVIRLLPGIFGCHCVPFEDEGSVWQPAHLDNAKITDSTTSCQCQDPVGTVRPPLHIEVSTERPGGRMTTLKEVTPRVRVGPGIERH